MEERRKGPDEKHCFECGEIIRAKAEICPKCGVRQPDVAPPQPVGDRNKYVAALLAFFLGGLGFHKFYLRRPWQGVLYLVFCWTLIPALFALIEALYYLVLSEREFTQRYGAHA